MEVHQEATELLQQQNRVAHTEVVHLRGVAVVITAVVAAVAVTEAVGRPLLVAQEVLVLQVVLRVGAAALVVEDSNMATLFL